ncbi:MAG: hypothetical protein IPP48_12905 [Chitinophagaceae bacterium]|nr:hypothetical protein [Chitinophagaceae bacterium]
MHTKTIVQLQVFSGRRNPQWELTEQQKKAFVKLWIAAKVEEQKINLPSNLGYQGFVVWDNLYKWIIYNGHAHRMHNKVIETKKDTGNGIELFLRNTLPKNIAVELKEMGL